MNKQMKIFLVTEVFLFKLKINIYFCYIRSTTDRFLYGSFTGKLPLKTWNHKCFSKVIAYCRNIKVKLTSMP